MPELEIENTALEEVKLIVPRRFQDERGFFSESWNRKKMASQGLDIEFVQDNHSFSKTAGTVRGLHYQKPPHAQAKLVRCGRGRLLDIAVDARADSPTYGHWVGYELSFENGRQLLVPKGFLHGFATLEPDTEIVYKCSDYYDPDCDGTVAWNDPNIKIDWQINHDEAILSDKDVTAPSFAEFETPFSYEGGQ